MLFRSVSSAFQQAFPGVKINQQALIQPGGEKARFVKADVNIKEPDQPGEQDVFYKMNQLISQKDQNINLGSTFKIARIFGLVDSLRSSGFEKAIE